MVQQKVTSDVVAIMLRAESAPTDIAPAWRMDIGMNVEEILGTISAFGEKSPLRRVQAAGVIRSRPGFEVILSSRSRWRYRDCRAPMATRVRPGPSPFSPSSFRIGAIRRGRQADKRSRPAKF